MIKLLYQSLYGSAWLVKSASKCLVPSRVFAREGMLGIFKKPPSLRESSSSLELMVEFFGLFPFEGTDMYIGVYPVLVTRGKPK